MPTPDSLTLPNINPVPRRKPHRFEPGNKHGRRRLKGCVNKVTKDIKNGILTAAENLGRDGQGTGGFIGYLEYIGWNHPKAFAHLLGKMMPLQTNVDVNNSSAVNINIVGVEPGVFLNADGTSYTPPPEEVKYHEPLRLVPAPNVDREFEPRTEKEPTDTANLIAVLEDLARRMELSIADEQA